MWFPSFLTLSSIAASIFWQKNEGKKSMVVMTSMCRDRRFCATHRAEEHIPVVRKRCKHSEGCDGYAYYGCPGSDKRMYCSVHRGEAGVPLKQTCTYLGLVLSDPKPWNPPKPPSPQSWHSPRLTTFPSDLVRVAWPTSYVSLKHLTVQVHTVAKLC